MVETDTDNLHRVTRAVECFDFLVNHRLGLDSNLLTNFKRLVSQDIWLLKQDPQSPLVKPFLVHSLCPDSPWFGSGFVRCNALSLVLRVVERHLLFKLILPYTARLIIGESYGRQKNSGL